MNYLEIKGARQNNLKGISLRLPHDSFIAVTGLSGSGKSSLAFDTIFAEGQWRFIESLSTYARLFLEKLDRPDVDSIRNIRPAIALEQRNPVKGSRSTVGTLTEIYDLFRILYSKVSKPFCPSCGKEIINWTVESIFPELLENHNDERAIITFESPDHPGELMRRGYSRILRGERIVDLQEPGEGNGAVNDDSPHSSTCSVVVDRVVIRDDSRVVDSLELAYREGGGSLSVHIFRRGEDAGGRITVNRIDFLGGNICDDCRIELPEPSPLLFSFNHPVGACPECKGFGNVLRYDEDLIVPDPSLSISEGAIEPWEKPAARWWKEQFLENAEKAGIEVHKPCEELTERERAILFKGGGHICGIEDFFDDLDSRRYKLHVRVLLSRYRSAVRCPSCMGKRLRSESTAYRIAGRDISELCNIPIKELSLLFREIPFSEYERKIADEVLKQIDAKLRFLLRVGLDYLDLNRLGKTLSGGEYQRVNLANQIASLLTGTLYVLDEPTVGLHARDTERIAGIIKDMSSNGNTLIVVEHDRRIINSADWIVELGPGGGREGGNVVFSGPREDFLTTGTVTAKYLSGCDRNELNLLRKRKTGVKGRSSILRMTGARGNNLRGIDLSIPLNSFIAVTGVSGSGKSSLVTETLYKALAFKFRLSREHPLPHDSISGADDIGGVRLIDQKPIGKTPRSNPVTYLKIFEQIRRVLSEQTYARSHGYTPGFFSFNIPGGRCERCKGEGFERLEMYFFEDLYVSCEQCGGRRYGTEALKVTYKGKNIHDILMMTVEEAIVFFAETQKIHSRLAIMKDIGLGYLTLGQPATSLSGGEAQRLKICSELGANKRKKILYILDEPTVGLHYRDVLSLLNILRNLVEGGNTVIVIEHNLDVVSVSDWVIDLGPGGGPDGGRIVFEGRPCEMIHHEGSITGMYLRKEWGKTPV